MRVRTKREYLHSTEAVQEATCKSRPRQIRKAMYLNLWPNYTPGVDSSSWLRDASMSNGRLILSTVDDGRSSMSSHKLLPLHSKSLANQFASPQVSEQTVSEASVKLVCMKLSPGLKTCAPTSSSQVSKKESMSVCKQPLSASSSSCCKQAEKPACEHSSGCCCCCFGVSFVCSLDGSSRDKK